MPVILKEAMESGNFRLYEQWERRYHEHRNARLQYKPTKGSINTKALNSLFDQPGEHRWGETWLDDGYSVWASSSNGKKYIHIYRTTPFFSLDYMFGARDGDWIATLEYNANDPEQKDVAAAMARRLQLGEDIKAIRRDMKIGIIATGVVLRTAFRHVDAIALVSEISAKMQEDGLEITDAAVLSQFFKVRASGRFRRFFEKAVAPRKTSASGNFPKTGVSRFDRSFVDAPEYPRLRKQMENLGYEVLEEPVPGGSRFLRAGVDPVNKKVYLDPGKADTLTLFHEHRHVLQYSKLEKAGLGPTELRAMKQGDWKYLDRYLEQGTLNFEAQIAKRHGFSQAYFRDLQNRIEQFGWNRSSAQKYLHSQRIRELIDNVPFQ
jgi:hypothetical protein